MPVERFLFRGALDAAGMPNLTDHTYRQVLLHPSAVLMLAIAGAIALATLYLQYASVITVARRQPDGQRNAGSAAPPRTGRARWLLVAQAPMLALYLFLVMPLGGLAELSPLTRDIAVPPFVTAEYLKKPLSTGLYLSATSVVAYLNLRLVATLPIMALRRLTPTRAMAASWTATGARQLRIPLAVGAPLVAAALAYGLVERLLAWCATLPGALLQTGSRLVASLGLGASQAAAFIVVVVGTVALIRVMGTWLDGVPGARGGAIAAQDAGHLEASVGQDHAPAGPERPAASGIDPLRRLGLRVGAAVGAVAIAVAGAPAVAATPISTADPLVIAHRGYVWGGVENTLGALEAAAAQEPDLVEVDVQQTKDGHFIASHDTNLLVLSGRNVNTYDLTLAEAQATTVSARGFADTIPSMVDYVRRARELGVKLLIEPKVHHHESADYLERFISELESVGPLDANIYHSLDAGLVEALKARHPELSVGYTIAMTLGGIPAVGCDFLVVEQASYSQQFMEEARAARKPVYVWTVNREERIRSYLYDGVAGVVTDHPGTARDIRSETAANPGAASRLRDAIRHLGTFVPSPAG